MVWIAPVFDRTEEDVRDRTPKGYLKYEDLNRIEQNLSYLAMKLGLVYATKDWSGRPLIFKTDLTKILDGLTAIRNRWPVPNLPENPRFPVNDYEKVNQIEKIEYLIGNNIMASGEAQMRCGEMFAGESGVI